jgi:hypothetical protein
MTSSHPTSFSISTNEVMVKSQSQSQTLSWHEFRGDKNNKKLKKEINRRIKHTPS